MSPAARELGCLAECLDHHALLRGTREAAVDAHESLSWQELQAAVNTLAAALAQAGIAAGQRLVFLGPPGLQFWVSLLACQRVGLVWVGLNPQYSSREMTHVLADSKPTLVIAATAVSRASLAALREASALAGTGEPLVLAAGSSNMAADIPGLGAELPIVSGDLAAELAESQVGLIVYTSGTTGKPKGALITRGGLVENGWWLAQRLGFEPHRTLVNLPVNHIGCVGDVCATALIAGGAAIFMERFDPVIAIQTIREQRIAWVPQVPAQFQLMLGQGKLCREDLAGVRCITWGGAPMPAPLIETLQNWVPDLFNSYGLTECSGTISLSRPGSGIEVMAQTVGAPVHVDCVRIVDAQGQVAETLDGGEIQLRGRHVFHGYLNNPDATRDTFTADGWLRTGDLGAFDEQGNIRLLGRTREMFKSGGYNVYPREIEEVIESLDGVELCAVVSVPDELWQEVGVAFIQADPDRVSGDSVISHCGQMLARYKLPKQVVVRRSLPLLPIGKVDKPRLRQDALALGKPAVQSSAGHARCLAALQDALECATHDTMVSGAMAMVSCPLLDLRWHGAAGYDDQDGQSPQRADRPFRIASVSKLHVAAAVLRLVEQRRLSLYRPVEGLIGEETAAWLRNRGYMLQHITVSQLLSHTSGLRDHAAADEYRSEVLASPHRQWTRADQIAVAMGLGGPLAEPGERFYYSDTGYVIIGEIIERVTGQSLAASVRGLLDMASLGLSATYWEAAEASPAGAPQAASQYISAIDATAFDPSLDLYGGGGLVSTLEDLSIFARALFRGEIFENPGTLATGLLVPRAARDPEGYIHSRLAMVIPMGETLGWGHLGFWGCGTVWCPELDITVSVSINQASPDDPKLLGRLIAALGNAVSSAVVDR